MLTVYGGFVLFTGAGLFIIVVLFACTGAGFVVFVVVVVHPLPPQLRPPTIGL
jgi:hypothetical protein